MRLPAGLIISIGIFILIEFYSYTAIQLALRNYSRNIKYIILGIYFLVSLLVWISMFTFRRIHFDEWPDSLHVFIIAFVMGILVGKLIMATFMVIDDLRRLFTWMYRQITLLLPQAPEKPTAAPSIGRSTFMANMALLAGGLFLGAFLWGTRNRYRYQLKHVPLTLDNLPEAFRGLKIIHISDIHSGSFDQQEAVAHGIDMIMAQKPDLILFTGDLVNNKASELVPYKHLFQQLRAPLGVYSILGNHDYGDYHQWPSESAKAQNLEDLKKHQAEMGWKLLMNEHVLLEKDTQQLALIGVENWSASSRFPKHGRLDKAYQGLEGLNIPKILMSHDPSHWEA